MAAISSTAVSTDSTHTSAISRRLSARPLLSYFILAYAGAWLALLPPLLAQNGLGILPFKLPLTPFLVLCTFSGPALAALLVAWAAGGPQGVRDLLRRYTVRPSRSWWFVLAVFGPIEAFLLFSTLSLGAAPMDSIRQRPLVFLMTYIASALLGLYAGPIGEELGWRAFALPRLQKSMGALRAGLLLGVLWVGWHLPLFFFPEWKGQANGLLVLGLFFCWVVPFSVIMTWVYNCSHGNLLVATLLHGAANASAAMIGTGLLVVPNDMFLQAKVYGALALIVILVTRGKLGIDSYQEQPAVAARPAGSTGRKRLTTRRLIIGGIGALVLLYTLVNIAYDLIHGPK